MSGTLERLRAYEAAQAEAERQARIQRELREAKARAEREAAERAASPLGLTTEEFTQQFFEYLARKEAATAAKAKAEAEGKRKLLERAVGIVWQALEDLRHEVPEIARSPLSEVTVTYDPYQGKGDCDVQLKWGKKFKMTDAEDSLYRQYRYKWQYKSPRGCPDSILGSDYKWIKIRILSDWKIDTGEYEIFADQVISNSSTFLPLLSKQLKWPSHEYRVLCSGRDYWTSEPTIEPNRQ